MQQDIVNIIEEVKSGNKTAFKYLVEEHQQYAFRVAFRVVCNEEDAKDVVQESFIKVWKNINSFKDSIKNRLYDYYENFDVYIDFYREWTGNESVNKLKTLEPPLFEDYEMKVESRVVNRWAFVVSGLLLFLVLILLVLKVRR